MRWPGIEPGSNAWKASMLTITPPTLMPKTQTEVRILYLELREHRSESLISLNESEFASASPSPDNKAPPATPSSAVPQTPTSVPQTPTLLSSNPLTKTNSISTSSLNTITTSSSTTTARTGVQQQQRPQTARQPSPEPKVEKVERPSTARAKAEDDSSG